MKEYYNIVVNFDDYLYYFYEWEDEELDYIRTIPMFKVSKRVFKEVLLNKIKLDSDIYELIKNKLVYANNKRSSGCIICDGDNSLVLEFNKNEDIAISSLELKDELEIADLLYNVKKFDFKYTILKSRKCNNISRKDERIKKYLNVWLKELFASNNIDKIKFYYKEWFKKNIDNVSEAYNEMNDDLNKELRSIHYYIYELSILEHKKSGLSS